MPIIRSGSDFRETQHSIHINEFDIVGIYINHQSWMGIH